jgi:PKD repeat protein
VAGTYAAACAFYTVIYRKDPTLITFNSTLSPTVAQNIKNATKLIVYNNLAEWRVGTYDPIPQFNFTISGGQVTFNNTSLRASSYIWDFGDSTSSIESNPTHTYATTGTFAVKLRASKCGIEKHLIQNVTISQLNTEIPANNDANLLIYPNPTNATLNIQLGNDLTINSLKIYDIFGKQIIEETENTNQVDIRNLSNGIYIVEVESEGIVFRKKIIKN